MANTYFEKLKDPRWQKKRLEILQRDKWECQSCGTKTESLHVHHLAYEDGDPWEVASDLLITLCEKCHEDEGVERKSAIAGLVLVASVTGIKSAYALGYLTAAIAKKHFEGCDPETAWLEGVKLYFSGWPHTNA